MKKLFVAVALIAFVSTIAVPSFASANTFAPQEKKEEKKCDKKTEKTCDKDKKESCCKKGEKKEETKKTDTKK